MPRCPHSSLSRESLTLYGDLFPSRSLRETFYKRRQMGLAYLAFPGANHTRYEHSLGTMHVAHQLLEVVNVEESSPGLTDLIHDVEAVQTLRVAALLHDVGHPPFSHLIEEALRKRPDLLDWEGDEQVYYRHEDYSQKLINTDEQIREALNGFDVKTVANLAVGKAEGAYEVFNPLVDGDVDADRIDYVLRDCYHCGLRLRFHLDDLRDKIFLIEEGGARDQPGFRQRLCFSVEATPVLATILHARYRLIRNIHLHLKNRVATQMLIELFQKRLEAVSKDERKNMVNRLHSWATDSECKELLEQDSPSAVRKVETPARAVITGNKLLREVVTMNFDSLSPYQRMCLYLILSRVSYIPRLQSKIRDRLKTDLIVDIRESAPPKFCLLAPGPTNLYDRSQVLQGILVDSFRDLSVHVYGPDTKHPNPQEIRKALEEFIPEVAREVRTASYEERKIIDLEFVLSVMQAVENNAKESFQSLQLNHFVPTVWAYSHAHLQHAILYTQKILKDELGFLVERAYLADYTQARLNLSSKLGLDFERLTAYGMLYRVNQLVYWPGTRSDGGRWNSRVDRRLSGYGRKYLRMGECRQSFEAVEKAVSIQQDTEVRRLQSELFSLEIQKLGSATRGGPSGLGRKIDDIRREIAESNGFITTIG